MYCITKAAILSMVKVLALELTHKGIRVNGIAPGGFDTDMTIKVCSFNFTSSGENWYSKRPVPSQKVKLCINGYFSECGHTYRFFIFTNEIFNLLQSNM